MMKTGIYIITNKLNFKLYVGSAINIEYRWKKHKEQLRSHRHGNQHLQSAWNKYGEHNFEFCILEECNISELLIREQAWIDHTNCCTNGYNISPTAGSPLGVKHTDETKQRISNSQKGRTTSEKTKRLMSDVQKNKTNRNYSKWPCVEGQKCKCPTCLQKKRGLTAEWRKHSSDYNINYYYANKAQNVQY